MGSISSMDIGLSSIAMSGKIDKTVLLIVADCHYTATSSNNFFATSSYQQPQSFTVQSVSADSTGHTYGAGLTAGAFGCRGRVITSEPFYSRNTIPKFKGRYEFRSCLSVLE